MDENLVLIKTAECNSDICMYFGQRGNGIHVKLPAIVSSSDLLYFLAYLCETCGEQVRVVTEPIRKKVKIHG